MEIVFALYLFVGGTSPETANFMERVGTYENFKKCFVAEVDLTAMPDVGVPKHYRCIPVPKQ